MMAKGGITGKKILCSECVKNGHSPKLLGIVENADGVLRLWCKRCRKEIRVEIRNGEILTTGIDKD